MPRENLPLKIQAFHLMLWQLLIIVGLAVVILLVEGVKSGASALLGGACYWLPTLFFAKRIFEYSTARLAKRFIIAFFVGEMTKLLLSALMFLLIAKYLPIKVFEMMLGYIIAILAFWIVCGWSMRGQ